MGDASDGGRQGIEHLATEGQGEGKGRVKTGDPFDSERLGRLTGGERVGMGWGCVLVGFPRSKILQDHQGGVPRKPQLGVGLGTGKGGSHQGYSVILGLILQEAMSPP